MKRIIWLALGLSLLWGCDIQLPNGVFKCDGDPDCPGGFSCSLPENACFDEKCEGQDWDALRQHLYDTLGQENVTIECGVLHDACGRDVEGPSCDSGETCMDLLCGCQESCGSAECGSVPRHCSGGAPLDCGSCLGAQQCVDGRCVCPDGVNCDNGCAGGCEADQICVKGVCCTQQFPCRDNDCSPPSGLPDGCGGVVQCEPCDASLGLQCVQAEGGAPYKCASVDACGDILEPNDSEAIATELCTDGTCLQKQWEVQLDGVSLEDAGDEDHYVLRVPESLAHSVHVEVRGLDSVREIQTKYLCPDGSDGKDECSGSSSNDYCIEDGRNTLALYRSCGSSGIGTLYIIVGSKSGEYKGPCDEYSLRVWSEEYDYDD